VEITEFYAARLDEDEAAAKAALPGPWMTGEVAPHLVNEVIYGQSRDWPDHIVQVANVEYGHNKAADSAHIVRHDPVRVLREVEAKRAILALHEPLLSSYGEPSVCRSCWPQPWIGTHPLAPCPTMRNLAAVYSDHPDYDPSWAPEAVSA
jgi:hypothetical protein